MFYYGSFIDIVVSGVFIVIRFIFIILFFGFRLFFECVKFELEGDVERV